MGGTLRKRMPRYKRGEGDQPWDSEGSGLQCPGRDALLRLRDTGRAQRRVQGPIPVPPGSTVVQPAASACARSPAVCYSWHFQGSDTYMRGPSLLLGHLMKGPHGSLPPTSSVSQTLSSLSPKLHIYPSPSQMPGPPGWGGWQPCSIPDHFPQTPALP